MIRVTILLMAVPVVTIRTEEETLGPRAVVQAKTDKAAAAMADHPMDRPTDPKDRQRMAMKTVTGTRGRKDVKGKRDPTDLLRPIHPILKAGTTAMLEMVIGT